MTSSRPGEKRRVLLLDLDGAVHESDTLVPGADRAIDSVAALLGLLLG